MIVYCPSHLTIHTTSWCTCNNHVQLNAETEEEALIECRRRGYTFYHGDVENLRDSARDPKVGDLVGDPRYVSSSGFDVHMIREVVFVDAWDVYWRRLPLRPDAIDQLAELTTKRRRRRRCSRKSWRRWAVGGWRCGPDGAPTRKAWRKS